MRLSRLSTLRAPIGILPLACAALGLIATASARSEAGLDISVQSATVNAGTSNDTVNVTLTNTGTSAVAIGGFAFRLSAASGITFTSVDTSTTLPYIFAGHSLFGPDISVQPPNLPGSVVEAEDNYSTIGSGISLGVGSANSVGLGLLHFNVSPTASGPITITLATFPATNFSDPLGRDITQSVGLTYSNGVVTVLSNTVVPEPSSLMMASISLGLGLGYSRPRKRTVG